VRNQEVLEQLQTVFSQRGVHVVCQFGEITITLHPVDIKPALRLLRETPEPGFIVFVDLTAVDYLEPTVRTRVVYLLRNPENGDYLRIVTEIARDQVLESITDLWEGADWYERELFDLFGIQFSGHPQLKRLLMPDDWKGHPLRRDYALTEEPVEFKHGVKPKIPSQVIPHVPCHHKS
jgi:NADH-quinone oxidoreductase subunit C